MYLCTEFLYLVIWLYTLLNMSSVTVVLLHVLSLELYYQNQNSFICLANCDISVSQKPKDCNITISNNNSKNKQNDKKDRIVYTYIHNMYRTYYSYFCINVKAWSRPLLWTYTQVAGVLVTSVQNLCCPAVNPDTLKLIAMSFCSKSFREALIQFYGHFDFVLVSNKLATECIITP